MGLLDSVLGSVMNSQNGQQPQGQGGELGGLGGLGAMGGAFGGLGGIVALAAQNPQLVQAVMGMLSNDGGNGGLSGLIEKFQRAGLGDVVASWLGSGANQPVSGGQVTQALGQGTVSQLGERMGVGADDAASQLAQVLPGLIDHFTPKGHAPEGGLGSGSDLMGMLRGLLQK